MRQISDLVEENSHQFVWREEKLHY